jgi:hypothetical protein
MGIRLRGTVFYADRLQVLVKWDDGRSESLRPEVDRLRLVQDAEAERDSPAAARADSSESGRNCR